MAMIMWSAGEGIISELLSSEFEEDKERVKLRLEERCKSLDRLMPGKYSDLRNVVEVTSKCSSIIQETRSRCAIVKNRVVRCRDTLQCRRDELRKLWSESAEQTRIIDLLGRVRDAKKVPQNVERKVLREEFREASEIIASSLALLETGDFRDVQAFSEMKGDLERQGQTLYELLLDQIKDKLYMSAIYEDRSALRDFEEYEKLFETCSGKSRGLVEKDVEVLVNCLEKLHKISGALDVLKETCHRELITIITKLSKFMKDVIIRSMGVSVWELPYQQQQRFLTDLTQTIILHFEQIASNHAIVSKILKTVRSSENYEIDYIYANMQSTLEQFVSSYIDEEEESVSLHHGTGVFADTENTRDISFYFQQSESSEVKRQPLFKFGNSSLTHKCKYVSSDDEIKHDTSFKSLKSVLICKPALKNITSIFLPVQNFARISENALNLFHESSCPLNLFLKDRVNAFLEQINSEAIKILENAALNLEVWSTSPDPDGTFDSMDLPRQVLSSVLIIYNYLIEIQKLLKSLSDYANHFLHLMHYVLQNFKVMMQKAFRGQFEDEKSVLSVSWARDPDIRRLLKSFSNWCHLEEGSSSELLECPEEIRMRNRDISELLIRNLPADERDTWLIIENYPTLSNTAILQGSLQWLTFKLFGLFKDVKEMTAQQKSEFSHSDLDEEDLREFTNSNSLKSSPSERENSNSEIKQNFEKLEDPSKLRCIASNSEYATKDDREIGDYKSKKSNLVIFGKCKNELVEIDCDVLSDLRKLSIDFEEFSDVCLLTLQLEVSAHCFFHLAPLTSEFGAERDFVDQLDICVKKLTQDLQRMNEVFHPVFTAEEAKYVLEGLGELLASLLIQGICNLRGPWSDQLPGRLQEQVHSLRRGLFLLQGGAGVGLERAIRFSGLLSVEGPEGLLREILEDGARFSRAEYLAACRLLLLKEGTPQPEKLEQAELDLEKLFANPALRYV